LNAVLDLHLRGTSGHLWCGSFGTAFRSRRDMPHQTKVVAPALASVASLIDERAHNVETEPADGALCSRRV